MKFLKDSIKELRSYKVGIVDEGEIKLDAMENPYRFSEKLITKIKDSLADIDLNRYPDSEYLSLREKISDYTGTAPSQILVGNGSDELILALYIACGGPGRRAASPWPAFSMYSILAELTETVYEKIDLEEGFSLPVKRLLSVRPDITFITYPNNPTAHCYDRNDILGLINSTDSLVVIDEAYYEFSSKTFADILDSYENVVILRTFSKAFGLAAIRAGYMLLNESLALQFRKVQMPYNLSSVNLKILETVLDSREEIFERISRIKASRDIMYERLKSIKGLKPYKSEANFILTRFDDVEAAVNSLKGAKIAVKRFNETALKDCLRITVGTEDENEKLIEVFRKTFRE